MEISPSVEYEARDGALALRVAIGTMLFKNLGVTDIAASYVVYPSVL